jgi:hypothetical protein
MARQTLAIVGRILPDNIHMRVMTCDATDARIRPVKALTVRQSIRLKPDRQFSAPMIAHHSFPGSVTLPAKIRNVFRRFFAQIRRRRIEFAIQCVAHMAARSRVTVFTGHSGPQ